MKSKWTVKSGEYKGWTTTAKDMKTAHKNYQAMLKRKAVKFSLEELKILDKLLELMFTGIEEEAKEECEIYKNESGYFGCFNYDTADKLHDKIITLTRLTKK